MNTAGKTYLDILKEHYPNVVLNELYGYCPAGFFKYGMDMHHPDCSAQCDECWLCVADSEWCENGEYDVPKEWKAAAEQDKPSELPAPVRSEAAVPTDKYAEAVQLNAQIMTSAKAAQQNLYDMAMGFKKMRDDKLYKDLGYDNFGDYCEAETGMHRKNVYRYIDIVEKLPSNFVSSMTQIGMTKLQLLSTIDEEHRTEIIENTDLESTTVKELREQIERLKQSEGKTKSQLDHVNTVYGEMYNSCIRNKKLYEDQLNKNADLERRIRELESRPVDVAVDVDELNRRVTEVANKMNSEMEHTLAAERKDFADTLNAKDDRIWELEDEVKKLKSSPTSVHNKKILAFQMSMDQYKKLLEIVNDSNNTEIYKVIQSVKIFS